MLPDGRVLVTGGTIAADGADTGSNSRSAIAAPRGGPQGCTLCALTGVPISSRRPALASRYVIRLARSRARFFTAGTDPAVPRQTPQPIQQTGRSALVLHSPVRKYYQPQGRVEVPRRSNPFL